jgi:hypothetical protein
MGTHIVPIVPSGGDPERGNSRKIQLKFGIFWEMHYKNLRFWLMISRWV